MAPYVVFRCKMGPFWPKSDFRKGAIPSRKTLFLEKISLWYARWLVAYPVYRRKTLFFEEQKPVLFDYFLAFLTKPRDPNKRVFSPLPGHFYRRYQLDLESPVSDPLETRPRLQFRSVKWAFYEKKKDREGHFTAEFWNPSGKQSAGVLFAKKRCFFKGPIFGYFWRPFWWKTGTFRHFFSKNGQKRYAGWLVSHFELHGIS